MFHLLRAATDFGVGWGCLTVFGVDFTMRNLGQVAQSVERGPEKAGVGGSIPSLGILLCPTNPRKSWRPDSAHSFNKELG